MNKVYARINWENYPSENTPLNESNLNKIDYGLNEVDNRVIELDTTKVSSSALSDNIKSWSMDETTGIITIEKYSGEKVLFDLNIEKIPVSFSLSDDGILTMTTDDGTQFTADIGSMIPVLTFNDSETIAVSVTGTGVNKTYSFSIKNGSVTGDMLEENYLSNINVKVAEAEGYANTSSTNATESGNSATLSESWAVGGTGTRDGENTNNAKYYAEQAAAVSNVEIATTEKAGLVKPDGTTITVDADGTIHGNASVTVDSEFSTESKNPLENSTTTVKFNEVDTTLSSHTEAISSLNTELGNVNNAITTNLLNPTLATTTLNGVTCTNNGDGTYTLNGTATSTISFLICDNLILNKTYKLVGCVNGGSIETYSIYIGSTYERDYGNGVILNPSVKIRSVSIVINNGATCDNLVFKPMLTTNLNATYDDFVPFGQGFKSYGSDKWELIGSVTGANSVAIDSDLYMEFKVTCKYGTESFSVIISSLELNTESVYFRDGSFYNSSTYYDMRVGASKTNIKQISFMFGSTDKTANTTMAVYGKR